MRERRSASAVMRTAGGPATGPGTGGWKPCLRAARRRRVRGRVFRRGRALIVGWRRVGEGVGSARLVFPRGRCEIDDAVIGGGALSFETDL